MKEQLLNRIENSSAKGEVMINFCFYRSVFKSLLLQRRHKYSVCGKGIAFKGECLPWVQFFPVYCDVHVHV